MGLAVGLISNSPFVLAYASLPLIAGVQTLGEGSALGFFVGDKLITVGVIGGTAAIAELSGGIYLLSSTRRRRPRGGLAREIWNAGFYAGLGLAQGIHGVAYIAIGIPLLAMSDQHLKTYLLAVKPYRVLGVASLAVGGLLAIVGGAFGIVGWLRGPELLSRVTVAPLWGSQLAGLSLGGRF